MKSSNILLHTQHIQILKLVAMEGAISRTELSGKSSMSKMTISNYVSDLLRLELLEEAEMPVISQHMKGRRPTVLKISSKSPVICGILIKRKICQAIIADLSGHILDMRTCSFPAAMSAEELVRIVANLIRSVTGEQDRSVIGCGIASVGPVNTTTGTILTPPDFYDIRNLNIVEQVSKLTGLHTVLINDATAGALAEKLYGIGKDYEEFAYLHIMNGIGMGFVINGEIFNGFSGQSGEIGHVSINFNGPVCSCGNRGCLEMYANEAYMNQRILELSPYYPSSPLSASLSNRLSAVIEAAARGDAVALNVLDEFLNYLSQALISMLNLLDFSLIITGYQCEYKTNLVERILRAKINPHLVTSGKPLRILRSGFGGDAPLIGACAVIADEVFSQRQWEYLFTVSACPGAILPRLPAR